MRQQTVSKVPRRPRRIGTKWIVIEGKRHKVKVFESAAARGSESGWKKMSHTDRRRPTLSRMDGDPEEWGQGGVAWSE